MPSETIAEKDRSAGVSPVAPWRVVAARVLPAHRLALAFADGLEGEADLSRLVSGKNPGVYAALANPAFFGQAKVELGVVVWPNGADLDPDWLHEEIRAHGRWIAPE
jgi:hypothetical protein